MQPDILLRRAVQGHTFKNSKQAFICLKKYFLQKRFPKTSGNSKELKTYLPKISINFKDIVQKKEKIGFYPEKIFIEKDVQDFSLTKSILSKFPRACRIQIKSLNNYIKSNKKISPIRSYNLRTKNIFLVKETYDLIKPCPCSKGVVGCGYNILNLGFGCPYECSYCFLQAYTNISGIVLPVNISDFLNKFDTFLKKAKRAIRIGTGEFSDSLALDRYTNYSQVLIDYFSKTNNATLELKTKSSNIGNILNLRHNRKTVISWSLNPQPIIDSDEWLTASLDERLNAAKSCCDAGYMVGFHFDPIIYSDKWEELYREMINNLFSNIDPKNIAWISLGTFRFVPQLKTVIEQRFPQSKILDEELIIGFDYKLRYSYKSRVDTYKKIYSWIRGYYSSTLVYLCMETREVWQEVLGRGKYIR